MKKFAKANDVVDRLMDPKPRFHSPIRDLADKPMMSGFAGSHAAHRKTD
ncbi:MAG: hypothetical protein GY904_28295 [Planctomycetaceae bacterium]|nr:hypothetical protein [Planctomycetaceae bacterium]